MSTNFLPGSTSTPLPTNLSPQSSQSQPSSPLNSICVEEKVELSNLNKLFACYVDCVHKLKRENSCLRKETTHISNIYKAELENMSRKRSRLEMEMKNLSEKNKELTTLLSKKTKECSAAVENALNRESQANELNNIANRAKTDHELTMAELNKARKDVECLRKQLDTGVVQNVNVHKSIFRQVSGPLEINNSRHNAASSIPLVLNRLNELKDMDAFYESSSANGNVQIYEIDGQGQFIKLLNSGNDEIDIGGWQLQLKINEDGPAISYKFHPSVKIQANDTLTIWSSDSGTTHDPPSDIVMKQQKWISADYTKTFLLNNEGEAVAILERSKRIDSMPKSNNIGADGADPQQGDLMLNEEKCVIM